MSAAEYKIEEGRKVVAYAVVKDDEVPPQEAPANESLDIEQMHDGVKRDEVMPGRTYKIRSPMVDEAFYITINDIVLNEGTEHVEYRPFEIFINSKNTDAYQWVSALTLVISAIFRKGGDLAFLVDELKGVFDPKGGYFRKGRFMTSVVAHVGCVIEDHIKELEARTERARAVAGGAELAEVVDLPQQGETEADEPAAAGGDENPYPDGCGICPKCNHKSLRRDGGCEDCLNSDCDYSKCG